jgi:hypothetical protein
VGPTYQLCAERRGRFPVMAVETGRGIDAACRPTRPGDEGSRLGRSGPVWKEEEKNQKSFDFRI